MQIMDFGHSQKFNVLDQMRTGRLHRKVSTYIANRVHNCFLLFLNIYGNILYTQELEEFYRIESRLAASTIEEIQREKDEASLAAIAVWPNFDEANEEKPSSIGRAGRDTGNMWGGCIANPLQQRTFSGAKASASSSGSISGTSGASLVVNSMTGMYHATSLSEQTEPMLSSYAYQEEDC